MKLQREVKEITDGSVQELVELVLLRKMSHSLLVLHWLWLMP